VDRSDGVRGHDRGDQRRHLAAFYSWAPELFPAEVRGRAVGIVNMVGKTGSVIGTLALPSMFDALAPCPSW